MTEERPFEGRTAVVTGAGRGIGRAIALGLADAGARVALLARSKEELEEAADSVRDRGGVALVVPTDVGDPGAVTSAVERITAELQTVDILVNDAGVIWPVAPSTRVAIADWASALAINLTGAVNMTLSLLPNMLARKWGRIVNVSSGVAARPGGMIGANAYVTSKAALEAHTLNLAAELADTGVTVNAYRPGGVDTAMQGWIRRQSPEAIGATLHERFIDTYARGRLITPEESARSLLARLPSDATGEIWNVSDA